MKRLLTLVTFVLYSQSNLLAESSNPFDFSVVPGFEKMDIYWNHQELGDSEKVELTTVIKKIGQGRKSFSNPVIVDRNIGFYRLPFPGLADVFIRFRVLNSKGAVIYEKIERTEVLKENVETFVLDGRKIYVFLPPGYSDDKGAYDVLLMQDGQNLFSEGSANSPTEWKVDETVTHLINLQKIDPIVVVGISSSTDRVFSYWPHSFGYSDGKGEEYSQWVINSLIPLLHEKFSLISNKWAVSGSSYGAVISLYLGFNYREYFSRIGAISPAMDLGGQKYVMNQEPGLEKVYIDAGEKEQYKIIAPQVFNFPENAISLTKALIKNGYVYGKSIAFFEDPQQVSHKEDVVAARLQNMILFLFNNDRTENSIIKFPSATFKTKENVMRVYSDGFKLSELN